MTSPGIVMVVVAAATTLFTLRPGLQCAVAVIVAWRPGPGHSLPRAFLFAGGTVLCVIILIFGIPADGG